MIVTQSNRWKGQMDSGWYPDPDVPGARRYWDGREWSAPLTTEATPAEPMQPAPAPIPAPQRRSSRRALIVAAVIVLLAGSFATYWFAIRSTTMTVRGTLDLAGDKDSGNYEVDPPDSSGDTACHGTGGYSDISTGVAVIVKGSDGKTIGTGALEDGIYIDNAGGCIFGWQVTVPDDEDSYGVSVSHRGTIQFTKAQMKAGPSLSLGDN